MEKHYKHFTITERDTITELFYERKTVSEIAKALGRQKRAQHA